MTLRLRMRTVAYREYFLFGPLVLVIVHPRLDHLGVSVMGYYLNNPIPVLGWVLVTTGQFPVGRILAAREGRVGVN